MLHFYQRTGEGVHPWPTMSADLWRPPEAVDVGKYEIVISDREEVSGFLTLADCPPVFVSLRRSGSGLSDEIVLGIPEVVHGGDKEQLAAAQLESAMAAAEVLPDESRRGMADAFGLLSAGSPGAGPRALRADGGPAGEICVSVFYADLRDDVVLSRTCPALAFNSQLEKLAVAERPEEYARHAFKAAAASLRGLGKKARLSLAAEFGLDLPAFMAGADKLEGRRSR